jgi:hypothetical protein
MVTLAQSSRRASNTAAGAHFVTLAETQILKSAIELGLLIDQARVRARRAAGEKGRAKNHRKNHRFNFHGIFLSFEKPAFFLSTTLFKSHTFCEPWPQHPPWRSPRR